MPTYTVKFDVTVSNFGQKVIVIPNVIAPDAKTAIDVAETGMVRVVATSVLQTAP